MTILETGEGVQIHPSAIITAQECYLDDRTVIGENVIIEGRFVRIGKEGWLDRGAHIGGGSCHDPGSALLAGDFLHMGVDSHINIAREVMIGNEVGIGIGTKIFTHGAYLPADYGFPAQWGNVVIGSYVWLPHAWVHPGVTIGEHVVVSAMSLVNKSLPSGCLAGGIPVKIIKKNAYPNPTDVFWDVIKQTEAIIDNPMVRVLMPYDRYALGDCIRIQTPLDKAVDYTTFDLGKRTIEGPVTKWTRVLKNQLRRNGIRFRYKEENGEYVPW